MFPLPYSNPLNWALYSLLAAEGLMLFGGLACGKLNGQRSGRLPRSVRVALSLGLLLAASLNALAVVQLRVLDWYTGLVFLGMCAGFVGDLIMAEVIRLPDRLIGGMAAFAVGHVAYLSGFVVLVRQDRSPIRPALLVVMTALIVVAWYALVHSAHVRRSRDLGSLLYSLVIGWMVALALQLALHDPRHAMIALGAWLFMCSDLLLGNWVIRGHVWDGVNDWVWVTYVSGQFLIVFSIATAFRVGL